MENENSVNPKKKTALIVVGLVIVLAVVIALALTNRGGETPSGPDDVANTPAQGDRASDDTPGPDGPAGPDGRINPGDEMEGVEVEVNPVLVGAVTQAPGADLITTDGRVVNQEGREVKTDVASNSPEAPRQTQDLTGEEISEEVIRLSVGDNGFEPNTFEVSAGAAVSIAMTGTNQSSHVFHFIDPELRAVYINTPPGQTRATTFNAPTTPGEYIFYCDFPGHRARGEEGKMIVR